jgi:hypothetical protein
MGISWGGRYVLVLFITLGRPVFGNAPMSFVIHEDVPRALSAQARGEIGEGFTKRKQDEIVLDYANSILTDTRDTSALPKMASLPAPLSKVPIFGSDSQMSVAGFINAGLNTHEVYSFISELVGRGHFDLLSLQAPLEAILHVLFRHHQQTASGTGITMGEADLNPAAAFIIQLYLAHLLEGTDRSFPEIFRAVKAKQIEAMTDLVVNVSGLARQMGALRKGVASPPLAAELLKAIASAVTPSVLESCLNNIRGNVSARLAQISPAQRQEVYQLLDELRALQEKARRGELKRSGFATRILFTVLHVLQKQIAIPVAVLHLINGTSYQIASTSTIPSVRFVTDLISQTTGIPIELTNQITLLAYEAVQHYDTRLEADLSKRYPGPGLREALVDLFRKIKIRYHLDLLNRERQWAGLPSNICLENLVGGLI